MSDPATKALRIQPATSTDQADVLRLLFAGVAPADREAHVAQALADIKSGPIAGLWAAYRGDQLRGAMLAQVQPGHTAVLAVPRVVPGEAQGTAQALLASAIDTVQRAGVRLAQVLLETDHGADADLLTTSGFRHVSNLLYLVSLHGVFPSASPQDGLKFETLATIAPERLTEIVRRTYQGSLDCPEIDGVRDLEDTLAGYRATGVYDAARWVLARQVDQDVGCVLLTDHPRLNQWELIYMGVVPEARGQHFGVAIVRHAQWLVRQAQRERLVLAVDSANEPAIAMYAAAGFAAWDTRSVFVRVF